MGGQPEKDRSRFYWMLRSGLELIKFVLWTIFQWFRGGGSNISA